MATVQASIVINNGFSATLSKLNAGLKQSSANFSNFKAKLASGTGNFGNKFKSGFNDINNGVKQSSGMFKSMLGANVIGNGISAGFRTASNGIRSIVGELDEASKAWQTFDGNMQQLGASPKTISSARNSMQDFAQKTIYSASDMASTYSQLAAVGTKNTGELVKGFGGLAAASSDPAQAMKTLSQQATQMAAMPKVQWADFKLMLQQTPAGISAVAKTMHKSSAELVQDIQGGKVKTQDFFNAISKAGTNANFSKMATQFKTVGQAVDGLRENVGIKLLPVFNSVSKIGIKAISDLADKVSDTDFSGLKNTLVSLTQGGINGLKSAGAMISQFFQAFSNTGALTAASSAISSLGGAMKSIGNAFTGGAGMDSLASSLGRLAGAGVTGAANAIKSVSDAVQQMNPGQIKAASIAILSLVAALKSVSLVKGGMDFAKKMGFDKIGGAATKAVSAVTAAFKGDGIIAAIRASFSGIGSVVSAAFSPVVLVIATISAVIAAAVAAWSSNFMNIQGVVSALAPVFGIVGNAIKSAFSNISSTLAPLAPAIQAVGAVVIGVLAVGFVAAAAAAIVLVAAGQVVVGVIAAIVHTGMAIGNVLTGNFKGAATQMKAAGDSLSHGFDGVKTGLGSLGKLFGTVKDSISQIGKSNPKVKFKADTSDLTKGVNTATQSKKVGKVKFNADTSQLTNSLDLATKTPKASTVNVKGDTTQLTNSMNLATGSKKSSTVNVKGDTSQLTNSLNTATSSKKAATVKVNADTTQLKNSMDLAMPMNKTSRVVKVDADTSAAKQKTAALAKPVKGGTVKYDAKVAKPKVPQPTKPKVATIAAPKVGKPKTPQPTKVKAANIAAPKVGKPKIPQPSPIKIAAIPAPKVKRPSMAPVVSAVKAGMTSAVAAVRSGGAQMASAVRSAVNNAAAAARAGAGAMRSAGAMIGAGLAAGMQSQVGAVAAAANALVAQANKAARAKAQIHSPSRLFAVIGDFMGQGMAVGMNGTASKVAGASASLAGIAARSASGFSIANGKGSKKDDELPQTSPFRSSNGTTVTHETTTTNNDKKSSVIVQVAAGAIQLVSSGNAEMDGEAIVRAAENYLQRLNAGSMS